MLSKFFIFLFFILSSSYTIADNYYFRSFVPGLGFEVNKDDESEQFVPNDMACGNNHCYIIIDSVVWSIGSNQYGQLGNRSYKDSNQWVNTGLSGVSSISASSNSGYAVKDGVVWTVGDNKYGNLGRIADYNTAPIWTQTNIRDVKYVSAGHEYAYAIRENEVWAVGRNTAGQLGVGNSIDSPIWIKSASIGFDKVVAGGRSGYGIKNGSLYVVGENFYGEIGLGDTTNQKTWLDTGITNITDVAGSKGNGYFIRDGEVFSTGESSQGGIADGLSTRPSGRFVREWTATGFTGVDRIYSQHQLLSVYATKQGDLYAAGDGYKGNLGFGDKPGSTGIFPDYNAFKKTSIANVSSLSLSAYATFVFSEDGIFSAGDNKNNTLSRSSGLMGFTYYHEVTNFPKKENDI